MASLPPAAANATLNKQGHAGIRLRPKLYATINEDLLTNFAKTELGAQRCSEKYLHALRIVLGNQADAEQRGYRLEMNIRNSCKIPERVLRNIIDQMKASQITEGELVQLGEGRSQVVQCYDPYKKYKNASEWYHSTEEQLEALYRATETYPPNSRMQELPSAAASIDDITPIPY